jgi:hypothetical protein
MPVGRVGAIGCDRNDCAVLFLPSFRLFKRALGSGGRETKSVEAEY